MSKATKVNIHKGNRNGVPALVVDYTIDGKAWVNHGVYIGDKISIVERVKKNLLEVGPITTREGVIFGE